MKKNLLISYLTLRKTIGLAGMLLFALVALGNLFSGNALFEDSISAYYWTNSRDIFVGVLFVTGALLITYKGYDLTDNILTTIAGISALGIAIFPCFNGVDNVSYFNLSAELSGILHPIFAISFFITLSIISWFQFTKGNHKKRNFIYKICAIIIWASILILALYKISGFTIPSLIYIMEIIMLFAFGISWLIKGKALRRFLF